jgi:hypothetical protein
VELTATRVLTGWVESAVTWNSRPDTGLPTVQGPVSATAGVQSLDVTEIVQAWHNVPYFGLELSGPEGGSDYGRFFESREHGEHEPQLVVDYHLPAPPLYTFSGHVYRGDPPGTGSPAEGITVELFGTTLSVVHYRSGSTRRRPTFDATRSIALTSSMPRRR